MRNPPLILFYEEATRHSKVHITLNMASQVEGCELYATQAQLFWSCKNEIVWVSILKLKQ